MSLMPSKPVRDVRYYTITRYLADTEGAFVAEVLIGLADAIEALRDELTTAIARGEDKPMRFALEPIELTVQAVVTKDASGKIGWNMLGVGGKYETARTQTVILKLSPLWQAKDGTLTSNFAIASVGEAGDKVGPHD
jgi:hypothetical protein